MVVYASQRFTRLRWGYGNGPVNGINEPSGYSDRWTVYVCPNCKTETGFEELDFMKHVETNFSNLMYPDRQAAEREASRRRRNENAFVDFYCSGCNGVVRAYYRYEPPEEKVHCGGVELGIVVERKTLIERPC
jgi:hypothetical protein